MKSSKPILFSGEMVKAILDGRKTQTRRIVKPQCCFAPSMRTPDYAGKVCPYGQPGTKLWVKETFKYLPDDVSTIIRMQADGCTIDAGWATEETKRKAAKGGWTPSIFMPRWASRITLEIVSIRVERVQEISEEDAKAEGVRDNSEPAWPHDFHLCPQCGGTGLHESAGPNLGVIEVDCENCDTYAKRFRILWQSINGPESWNENPFVWVINFKRI
jgi:hypothetical protein